MGTGSSIRRYKFWVWCSNPNSSIINSGLMDTQNCTSLGNQLISDSEDLQGKEQCDDSHCEPTDDFHVVNEIENNEEAIEEVILGKEFIDVESAYKFYKNYGGKHGFNVRIRNSRKNNENFVTWVRYCCAKERFREKDKRRTNASYSQLVTRCGCQAHLTILLQKNGNFQVIILMNYIYFETICRNLKAFWSVQKHTKIVNMMFNYLVF
ncbi:uncharacterized protein LOC112199417 [Rosa chinensis]|uniref:uncharacterized protein LOC112199417 n=1 Tax=Rosa chinensis TaxID=74649 RepID=UPI001AD94A39|nr:uncharacterized protein LOC112199417 [Rosa chinensis]